MIKGDLDIGKVVIGAIEKLMDMPNTVNEIVRRNYFVTYITEERTVELPNGLVEVKSNTYSVVDFTRPITFDKEQFMAHSEKLYDEFKSIKTWYEV